MTGNKEPTASDIARSLAAMRQRVTGECIVCGKPLEGVQRDGKLARLYCSYKCSKKAYRARKQQAALEPQEDRA